MNVALLIPQIFYDLIARIIPGLVIFASGYLVFKGQDITAQDMQILSGWIFSRGSPTILILFSFILASYVAAIVIDGQDFEKAKKLGRHVLEEDFHFLPDGDEAFDLIFARHALEHSPMPILALMEWHRVAKKYLILVLPKPKFWLFLGRNHYSVVTDSQAKFLLHRSGWDIIEEDHSHEWEYRYLCEKVEREFDPEEAYLWAYRDENLSWLDMAEPFEYEKEEKE